MATMVYNFGSTAACTESTRYDVLAGLIIKWVIVVPGILLLYILSEFGAIRLRIVSLIKGLGWLALIAWYIYLVVEFFGPAAQWGKESPPIWIAHLILVIDAFINFAILIPILWFVSGSACVLWCLGRTERGQTWYRTLKGLRKVMINATALQLDPKDIADDEECTICFDDYK